MDFKSMLQQLSQLSEGTQETEKGRVHKADPGGYGRKFDTDEEGDEDKKGEKKEPAAKRGRGRPKKGADSDTGQVAKYDNAKNLQSFMIGNLPKGKLPGKPGKKHSIKEWIEEIENKYLAEGSAASGYSPEMHEKIKNASPKELSAMASEFAGPGSYGNYDYELKMLQKAQAELRGVSENAPGQQLTVKPMPGAAQLVDPASNKVMATGDAAAVKNIQGAVAQGKVQMRGEEMTEDGVEEAVRAKISGADTGSYDRSPRNQDERDKLARTVKIARNTDNVSKATGDHWVRNADMPVDYARNKAFSRSVVKKVDPEFDHPNLRGKGVTESDEDYSAKKARAGKDIGKPGKQFAKIAKGAAKKYGSEESGKKVAGAVLAKLRKKVSEADIPSDQVDMGAGLGAGRNAKTFEGKKPDFLDLDKDKNKKEPMSDAAKDAEKKKKKLKENAHRHSAAKLLGKAHALARESYNCKYDDLDEVRMYHEGYKEGLDECYGQGVYETAPAMPPATAGGMAGQAMPAMEEDMFDEGNAFTKALAQTPPGGKFSVGGKTFTDRSNYNAKIDEFAFESLDKQLNALLNEDSVSEGMSVSISKGNQGAPDSVSVTAQDAEADQLLAMIKQSGLGLFGQEGAGDFGVPSDGSGAEKHGDINVVGDHDGMMSLIKKVTGASSEEGSNDYEDEEGHGGHDHEGHEHTDEETCNECGYMESKCQCDEESVMGEEESYEQEEEQVAEDNPPDSGAAETTADEEAEAEEDQALATADELNELDQSTVQSYKDKADPWNRAKSGDSSDALRRYNKGQDMANKRLQPKDDEKVTEWANDAGQDAEEFDEETFTTNEKFMTDTVSSGLNKKKSTGQTTVPVVASQMNRQMAYESILDIRRLAGIK